jgi:hypothetical protein
MGGSFGLRGEALSIVGNAIGPIIQKLADEKTGAVFEYGFDQTLLDDEVFPLLQDSNALTVMMSSRDADVAWRNSIPKSWYFRNDTFYEGICFGRKDFLGKELRWNDEMKWRTCRGTHRYPGN